MEGTRTRHDYVPYTKLQTLCTRYRSYVSQRMALPVAHVGRLGTVVLFSELVLYYVRGYPYMLYRDDGNVQAQSCRTIS